MPAFILLPFFLLFLCVPVGFVLLIVFAVRSISRGNRMSNDEQRHFGSLLEGLDRMEKRVDNLETILDRGRR